MNYIKRFSEISIDDIDEVGCKNALIGEISNKLNSNGAVIPDGFAITTAAYKHFIEYNKLDGVHAHLVRNLNTKTFENLQRIGATARELITHARMPDDLAEAILYTLNTIFWDRDPLISVLSSPTNVKFKELLHNSNTICVKDRGELLKTVQLCFASLFSDEAIKRRAIQNTEHSAVAISVGILEVIPPSKGKLFIDHIFELPETLKLTELLSGQHHDNFAMGYDAWNYRLINSY